MFLHTAETIVFSLGKKDFIQKQKQKNWKEQN
jgi:hypothetical protein